MGAGAIVVLIVGAIIVGLIEATAANPRSWIEPTLTGIGGFIGGFVAGDHLGRLSRWGGEWNGLHLIPALIGGLVVAAVVAAVLHTWLPQQGTPHSPTAA